MFPYLFLVIFAAILYWFVAYQFHNGYKFSRLNEKLIPITIRKKLNPFAIAVLVFLMMAGAIVGLNRLFIFLNYRIEWLFMPILIAGVWAFIRDLRPIQDREQKKSIMLLKLFLSLSIGSAWFIYPSWWTYNIIAFILGVNAIRALAPINLKYLLAITLAVSLYDLWGVLISREIVEAVQETVYMSGLLPPVVVLVPNTNSLLGVGDLVFPGILLVSVIRNNMGFHAYAGFGIGLALTMLIHQVAQIPLPAMVFLGPTTFIAVLVGSKIKNERLGW